MCGDSTVATDVAALLSDVEPHLMVTDPPMVWNMTPIGAIMHYAQMARPLVAGRSARFKTTIMLTGPKRGVI